MALRTPANIADRLVTVLFRSVMFRTPVMTTPDTVSMIMVVTMTSIRVKPASLAERGEGRSRISVLRTDWS